jgi:hypothetical protein
VKFRRARAEMPAALKAALEPDEQITSAVPADGGILAVSRFGLWIVDGEIATRIDWHLVSKAQLTEGELRLTVADEIATWPDSTVVLRDRAPRSLHPQRLTRLTDAVHHRVRASVAESRHLDWPGAGGWVVLRRVAGRDGLTVQLRLDAGADPGAAGFADAVADLVDALWPESVPRPGAREG